LNLFWCVSADTKTWACWLYVLATLWLTTCGSPLNPLPTGGLRLPADKHTGILTDFQTIVNKKKQFFINHGFHGFCFSHEKAQKAEIDSKRP
jgi:hypothetical protein